MNDTPTPRTDAAYTQRPNEGAWDFKVRQEKTMESLERELTAAREELKAVTEQRDGKYSFEITPEAETVDDTCPKCGGLGYLPDACSGCNGTGKKSLWKMYLESLHNANVDLPDTAAQDSTSKSNSPAVSG